MSSTGTTAFGGCRLPGVKQEILDDRNPHRAADDAWKQPLQLPAPVPTCDYPSPKSTTSRRKSSSDDAQLTAMGDSTEACSYPSGTRHDTSSHARGFDGDGPPSLASISPRTKQHPLDWPGFATPSRHNDQHRDFLTLQIPKALRQAHHRSAVSNDDHQSQLGLQQPTPRSSAAFAATSLPSFASFQEASTPRASNNDDLDDAPEIASLAARPCCNTCNKLKPLVRDVVLAVAELDETVQTLSSTDPCNINNKSRDLDFPKDDSVRAVQWILERLRYARMDLQAARGQHNMYYPQQPLPQRTPQNARDESPANSLKRHTGPWEEYSQPKRTCSTSSFDQPQRADSMNYLRNNSYPRSGYTPPPTASDPSTYQKITTSPSNRGSGLLPSPASMQPYSHSATPSNAPQAQSTTSPPAPYALSSNPQGNTNTNNGNDGTRIADLQHQITLKSLALQTLQSEYASLLQKLQRERVKSQTIERKTTAADQEVNELTSKNEELAEQVRHLEARADEAEKKRETERADYARDKEQWGRMLDMGGKLQSRLSEEKQRLMDEKDELLKRVTAAEQSRPYAGSNTASMAVDTSEPGDATALSRDNRALRARVESLQHALDEILRCSRGLDEKAREILQQNSNLENIVRRHLPETPRATTKQTSVSSYPSQSSGTTNANDFGRDINAPRGSVTQQQSSVPDNSNARLNASASSMMQFGGFGSGPSDLAYNFNGTKSSPEDLIKALGPVPTPAPIHNIGERINYGHRAGGSQSQFSPLTRTHTSSRAMDEHSPARPATQAYRSLPSPHTGPTAPLVYPKDSFASYASSPASQPNYGSPSSSSGSGEDHSTMPPPPRPYSNWQISYSPDGSGPPRP